MNHFVWCWFQTFFVNIFFFLFLCKNANFLFFNLIEVNILHLLRFFSMFHILLPFLFVDEISFHLTSGIAFEGTSSLLFSPSSPMKFIRCHVNFTLLWSMTHFVLFLFGSFDYDSKFIVLPVNKSPWHRTKNVESYRPTKAAQERVCGKLHCPKCSIQFLSRSLDCFCSLEPDICLYFGKYICNRKYIVEKEPTLGTFLFFSLFCSPMIRFFCFGENLVERHVQKGLPKQTVSDAEHAHQLGFSISGCH